MKRVFLCLVALMLVVFTAKAEYVPKFEPKVIEATNPAIDYVTRAHINDEGVNFDWSGSYIRVAFTGGYLGIKISDSKRNWYDIFIDGVYTKTIDVSSRDTTIHIATGLHRKEHTAIIHKRTEASEGQATVHALLVAPDGEVLAAEKPKRKILYVGDSLTCGFGTESNEKTEKYSAITENSYKAFASIASRYFDADYHLIAHSGNGVVRNYGDKNKTSDYTMLDRFDKTFDIDTTLIWDHSKFVPDLVVTNLGTNDYTTKPNPDDEVFVAGYTELLRKIKSAYGEDTPILCMCKKLESVNDLIRGVVEESQMKDVIFVYSSMQMIDPDNDYGASYHPNYEGQKKMAMSIIPYISSLMKWSMESKPVE